jgi:cell division protein FtsQ
MLMKAAARVPLRGRHDMAGDYLYLPDVEAPTKFEKTLKVFIILAALCLGGEIVWLLGISPFRPFSKIDISGFEGIGRNEIIAKAGISGTSSYFSTDARLMEKALLKISSLESARVFKHFPGRLQIVLEGRQALASTLALVEGKTVPVLFDSHGVIFQIGADEKGRSFPVALPVISGLVIEDPFPGMRLPALFIPFFRELEKIKISAPELLAGVSEIRINKKAFSGFDIILYPMHKKTKVRLSELNEGTLRYTFLMVDVLMSKEDKMESLDFRTGVASYISKEASSEQ